MPSNPLFEPEFGAPAAPLNSMAPAPFAAPPTQADAADHYKAGATEWMDRQKSLYEAQHKLETAQGYFDPATDQRTQAGYLKLGDEIGSSIVNGFLAGQVGPEFRLAPGFRAFHGSPHNFDKFQSSKIGTGEGAQAYGHGLYVAGAEDTARYYRDALSPGSRAPWAADVVYAPGAEALLAKEPLAVPDILQDAMHNGAKQVGSGGTAADTAAAAVNWIRERRTMDENAANSFKGGMADFYRKKLPEYDAAISHIENGNVSGTPVAGLGHMYEVNIKSDPEHFLDWDKPMDQQSQHVQEALTAAGIPGGIGRGSTLYNRLGFDEKYPSAGHDPTRAAQVLHKAGIPGIRYLDGMSRGEEAGTHNTVVFDADTIEILRKYGLAGLLAGGGAAAATGVPEQ